ncbi:dTMP kinase [Parasaccharibacter sp. TMW 2.1891]|uniref:dTMP kinase n=1 Tax=Parasaccharibacter sp. TMW 2.1891 TaxID=2267836 RepID=UPI0020110D25|nr:dTMP kinase [Parasaccharibacter sp. TMW 2.1891]MCL1513488.1 dTMP kinase [Parasaccharibacter sp. TMW 2.1891]
MLRSKTGGVFITLEGGEGAGKSTQLARLSKQLEGAGFPVFQTREPGGTPAAEALRNLLLFGEESFCWQAEIMLHMAARSDHLARAIRPALAEGKIVLCDRFHDSTWAYQGYGIGEGRAEVLEYIRSLRQVVGGEPDVTLWLDLPCEVARQRISRRGGKLDRYEGQQMQFHQRVRAGFQDIAEKDPARIRRVDASQSLEEVQAHLYALVRQHMAGEGAA